MRVNCDLKEKLSGSLMDCSPPSSSVHEISQARILEWTSISFSRGSSLPRHRSHVSFILHLLHNHQHSFYPFSLSFWPHFSKVLSFEYYYELMAFSQTYPVSLKHSQQSSFIVISICGCPLMTTSLIIFKSIFVFAAAEMLSLEFTSPARGLPSFELMEVHGCTCGWARCCQTIFL